MNKELYTYKVIKEPTGIYLPKEKINNSTDLINILNDFYKDIEGENVEMFSVVMVNNKNKIIGIKRISIGCLNQCVVHPREVFRLAILNSAASIFLAHNHPSGDTTPSIEDENLTKRLVEAGKILGIRVLDHIILGDEPISLREDYSELFY